MAAPVGSCGDVLGFECLDRTAKKVLDSPKRGTVARCLPMRAIRVYYHPAELIFFCCKFFCKHAPLHSVPHSAAGTEPVCIRRVRIEHGVIVANAY